jgi:HPt (histidine-containing phosphotransfer) domain-containing protein
MGSNGQSSVAEAMNRLWAQYLPQLEERVRTLELAAAALESGSLTAEQCGHATAAAHKLAGVLGTFGLPEGTLLAREAEVFYAAGPATAGSEDGRATEVATQLRAILSTRK